MSTVYDPDARTVKHASVAIFLLTVTLGVIGPLSFSGGWWVYGCLSLGILRSTHRAVADSRTFPKISRYLL
ncbi:hypothetical protein RYA99_22780, partial [Pseudomonas syringae pv. actinidifoliorum]|nr:hypothetical protein [Pseudomonas syringae pv. actinidifoliorum]MDU8524350.1 hypothetical protein [Pseudomonas syringae pv. actinidifoliorum]MDU8528989.1 hypothetical protein [Pseudomonas syringae pv. actinidifoliorum]